MRTHLLIESHQKINNNQTKVAQNRNKEPHLYRIYMLHRFGCSFGVEWLLVDNVGQDFRSSLWGHELFN